MPNTAAIPEQDALFPSVVELLDNSRGVVDDSVLPEFHFRDETRTNITQLAAFIGEQLSPVPRTSAVEDKPLHVQPYDFRRADFAVLNNGLIIPRSNPLYRSEKAKRVVVLAHEPLTLFGLPGVVLPSVGVAMGSGGEYSAIARSASAMTNKSKSVTLDANHHEAEREVRDERAFRSSGHTMESALERLAKLDEKFVAQHALLQSIYRDANRVWRGVYTGRALDRRRREADDLIHEVIELAAANLNYNTPTVNAVHRAVASDLYRRGSATDLAGSWRGATVWAARYINAKRGKVNQSQNGCRHELRKFQPYLDKKAAEEIAVAS